MELEVLHSPNLKTILMVESSIKSANTSVTREQLKRMLPKQVMHQTLNVILAYLERSGKIYDGRKGITWIYNPSPELAKEIRRGVEYKSFLAKRRKTRTLSPSASRTRSSENSR